MVEEHSTGRSEWTWFLWGTKVGRALTVERERFPQTRMFHISKMDHIFGSPQKGQQGNSPPGPSCHRHTHLSGCRQEFYQGREEGSLSVWAGGSTLRGSTCSLKWAESPPAWCTGLPLPTLSWPLRTLLGGGGSPSQEKSAAA